MAKLNIDVSDGYCSAGCEHCKHGTKEPTEQVVFPSALIEMCLRLDAYANQTVKNVRVSYSNTLLTLPASTFIKKVDTLAFTFIGWEDISLRRNLVKEKILALCGDGQGLANLELHIHPPFLLEAKDQSEFLLALVVLQNDLITALPYTNIHVALNDNTFVGDLNETYIEFGLLLLKYMALLRKFRSATIENVATWMEQVPYGLQFEGKVRFKGRDASFSGRFLTDKSEIVSLAQNFTVDEEGPSFTVALFPWGVHVGHSTFNINETVRKFTYIDFGKLLDKAIATKVDLKQICREAMSKRWQKRIAISPLP